MTKKLYKLTDEHRAQLKPWADKWIANAMSTEPMTDADRDLCRNAVARLYTAAGKPPPLSVVFVPSPFVLAFAGGFAAAIWHRTPDAAADSSARPDPAVNAAETVIRAANSSAPPDLSRWYTYLGDMRRVADLLGVGKFGLECASLAWRMWQGGNTWSGYDGYLSFFRHVAKLELDYTAWDPWEVLSLHSGPRVVHEKFCMISDRPELLTVDDQNRPHNDTGPFCRWRDGSALYAVHGVRVPAWIVERPQDITIAKIEDEQNAEVRRVMLDRYGLARYVRDSGAERLDHDERWGTLYRREVPGDEPIVMIELINSSPEPDGSWKHYFLRVPPETRTSLEGNAWINQKNPQELAARLAMES